MILSSKMKEERRKFLFWFHKKVTSGSLLLTDKEAAWAGWLAGLDNSGVPLSIMSVVSCCKALPASNEDFY